MLVAKNMRDHPPTIKEDKEEEKEKGPEEERKEGPDFQLILAPFKYSDELNLLKTMGFTDEAAMKKSLEQAKGDINSASILLLDEAKKTREADIARAMAIAENDALGNVQLNFYEPAQSDEMLLDGGDPAELEIERIMEQERAIHEELNDEEDLIDRNLQSKRLLKEKLQQMAGELQSLRAAA